MTELSQLQQKFERTVGGYVFHVDLVLLSEKKLKLKHHKWERVKKWIKKLVKNEWKNGLVEKDESFVWEFNNG